MQRRKSSGRRKSSPLRWLGWLAVLLVASGILLSLFAPTLVTRLIRAYLLRQEFQHKAEVMLSALTGGEARVSTPTWSDDNVAVNELRLNNAHGWDADFGGLRAALDFGAIRNGVWRIQDVSADEFRLHPSPAGAIQGPAPTAHALDDSDNAVPAFLRGYIPKRVEISGCEVQRFFLDHSGWHLAESHLHAGSWSSGKTSLPFKLSGGTLEIPVRLPEQTESLKLNIDKGTLRLSEGQLQLSDARLRWKEASEATLRGSVKFDSSTWQTTAQVKAVPVAEFLNAWWKPRLTGQIKGDLEFSGSHSTPPAWKADAVLENGVLQGLPLLETLATHTKVERFKRLVLDICQASFRPQGEVLHINDIIVQSNGLLRIEGTMTLQGRLIEGNFRVGVTPEAVRWIPGAQNLVFVDSNPNGPPGLHWTRVRVTGTLDAPQEDLSNRLLGGAGMALLFDTPGQVVNRGADALLKPVLGDDAAKLPGKVMEGATGLLENGVKTGTDLLNKVLPVFPGSK